MKARIGLVGALIACVVAGSAQAQDIRALVVETARAHGVPAHIALGVVRVESGFRCTARNGHAHGAMQIMPQTARSVGVHGNLFDCRTGIEAGMRYLHAALERGGIGCAGISLYNRGIWARPRCSAYGRKVLALANREGV